MPRCERGEACAVLALVRYAAGDFARAVDGFDRCAELGFPWAYLAAWRALARASDARAWAWPLEHAWVRLDASAWPRPLFEALLDPARADAALAGAAAEGRERRGIAAFYLGAFAQVRDNPRRARAWLETARWSAPRDSIERLMADACCAVTRDERDAAGLGAAVQRGPGPCGTVQK